ncbi:MAG: histidinol-phosphate transaminase [Clostridia bacterium]|nr:histidinol-phosphate transaminase [Clostridia bacterium]
MSKYLSGRLSELVAYVPGEQPKDNKYIKLNTNESPYPPSPAVTAAISGQEIENLRLYGDPECRVLRKTLADYYGVEKDNVFIGNGSDEILSFAFMAYCDSLVGVSYPDISYGFYPVYADLYGIAKNAIPLREDFTIAPEDYFDLKTTIVIANPNAPTGICLTVADIESIVKANTSNLVIIDEAYVDFGGESAIPLTKKYPNLLVTQTYSKSRNFAGGRLGMAFGTKELIADLEKIRFSTNPYNVSRLTLLAGTAAIKDQDYYDNCNREIIRIRDYTTSQLQKLGFSVLHSKANFIFATTTELTGEDVYRGLRERGILVRWFNKPRISNFVRITIGTEKQMDELISAVKEMLKNA